ncbi:MAG: potassium channel protein [Bacteroidia bacterium]|nr:potassium channel protein [Bacteroidia bacterium]
MQSKSPLRKLWIALTLFLGCMIMGVAGFMIIEDFNLLDAVYMTVISVSTVGFGIVGNKELTDPGKVFVIVLMIFSAGAFVFAVTTLTTFVVEGELRRLINKIRFKRKISNMQNHIIVCGLGRAGRECVMELRRQGKPFLVIEKNADSLEDFLHFYPDSIYILGDATLEEVLREANITSAEALISALPNDAENVFIALTARSMSPDIEIIARAEHEYNMRKLQKAGANHVILPNLIGGRRMVNLITRPGLIEFVELISGETDSDIHLETFECRDIPLFHNKKLKEVEIRTKTGVIIVGRKPAQGPTDIYPGPETVLLPNDRIILLGGKKEFHLFREIFLGD